MPITFTSSTGPCSSTGGDVENGDLTAVPEFEHAPAAHSTSSATAHAEDRRAAPARGDSERRLLIAPGVMS